MIMDENLFFFSSLFFKVIHFKYTLSSDGTDVRGEGTWEIGISTVRVCVREGEGWRIWESGMAMLILQSKKKLLSKIG